MHPETPPTRTLTVTYIIWEREDPSDGNGVTYTVDQGDRAKKIWETVIDKYHKYSPSGMPIILVVFLGDHWVGMYDAQTAIYGASLHDGWLKDQFPHGLCDFRREIASTHMNPPPGGAMLPDESGWPGCPRLSTVLACDWFDTLNRCHPGKRLHCQVLHHWRPDLPVPPGQFGEFGEVTWSADSSGYYRWQVKGSLQTVAAFEGSDGLKFREYDWRDPW